MASTSLVAVLLGAGLAETLKAMATYVSSKLQLPTVMFGVLVGGVVVCAVQMLLTVFNHGHINVSMYAVEFGIVLLLVAQRFGA